MTIEAKIVSKPIGGHGLTDDLLEAIHNELVKGKPAGLIPALVLLQPLTATTNPGKNKRGVQIQLVRIEPVTNQADADRIRLSISEAYEARNTDGQATLDLGEEDARRYLSYIEEWRKERKLTIKAVGELWRESFAPDSGVLGDYRKAGKQPLYEFCLTQGIIHDEIQRA